MQADLLSGQCSVTALKLASCVLCVHMAEGEQDKTALLIPSSPFIRVLADHEVRILQLHPNSHTTSYHCCLGDQVSTWILKEFRHANHSMCEEKQQISGFIPFLTLYLHLCTQQPSRIRIYNAEFLIFPAIRFLFHCKLVFLIWQLRIDRNLGVTSLPPYSLHNFQQQVELFL